MQFVAGKVLTPIYSTMSSPLDVFFFGGGCVWTSNPPILSWRGVLLASAIRAFGDLKFYHQWPHSQFDQENCYSTLTLATTSSASKESSLLGSNYCHLFFTMLGPRKMYSGTTASVHNHSTDDYFSYGSRSQVPTHRHYEAPGVFDATPSPTKGSAKRLISQYERMDTPPAGTATLLRNKSTKNRQYVYDYRAVAASLEPSDLHAPEQGNKRSHHEFGQGGGGGSKKDHSPLRQSLRNLFSVIKKGAGGLTKRKVGDEGVGRVLHRGDSLNGRRPEEKVFSAIVNVPMGVDAPIAQIGKRQKLTGSIFYLTRTLSLRDLDHQLIPTGDISTDTDWSLGPGSEHLAWTSCNVTLDPSTRKMQLSSFNQEMQLVLHEISLAGCIDIRSLSVSQLSERVAKRLDEASVRFEGELGRLKAFEVRFDKRPKELFAVRSVKERAGWISAIWYGHQPLRLIFIDWYYRNVILPEANLNQPVSKKPRVRDSTQHDKPIENPRPIPLPEMTTLLSHSCSNRSLPPLPADVPEVVPKLESKKTVKLHLDIPPLNSVLSPSIYPPTSHGSSSAGTPLDTPTRDPRPPFLSNSNSSSTTVIRPAFLSPSTSPTTPRPASILSAISQSTSPSIMNLSQLSVVRQRLAQIERNHSQVFSRSSGSDAETSVLMPETPVGNKNATKSPSSVPSQSGRSKGKAEVLHAMTERGMTTESVPTLTAMNRNLSFEAGKLSLEGLTSLHVDGPPLDDAKNHDERMSKAHLTKQDVEDLSMQVKDVKGVLGGESGYPTIHQVVLGLDDKAQANGKALKTIQERINQLEGRLANATVAPVAFDEGAKERESVLHAIEDVKAKLATEFPLVMSTVQDLQSKQDRLLELSTERESEREVRYSDVASSEGAQKSADNVVDLNPVLNKLDELRVLFGVSRNAIEKNEGTEQPTKLAEVRPCLLRKNYAILSLPSMLRRFSPLSKKTAKGERYCHNNKPTACVT